MAKPFKLIFEYTPSFGANRTRDPKEQFTVTIEDISILDRLKALEDVSAEAPDAPEAPKDRKQSVKEFQEQILAQRKQVEWRKKFALLHIVRVNGLTVITREEKEIEVKSAEELEKLCPDVVQEVANRLLFGAGEEELKNLQSPSSAGLSVTAESEKATSTATATAS